MEENQIHLPTSFNQNIDKEIDILSHSSSHILLMAAATCSHELSERHTGHDVRCHTLSCDGEDARDRGHNARRRVMAPISAKMALFLVALGLVGAVGARSVDGGKGAENMR